MKFLLPCLSVHILLCVVSGKIEEQQRTRENDEGAHSEVLDLEAVKKLQSSFAGSNDNAHHAGNVTAPRKGVSYHTAADPNGGDTPDFRLEDLRLPSSPSFDTATFSGWEATSTQRSTAKSGDSDFFQSTSGQPILREEEQKHRPLFRRNTVLVLIPIGLTITFLLALATSGLIIGGRNVRDWWQRRQYRRVDFLIDGMYYP